jgi:glutaredoxin-like protein
MAIVSEELKAQLRERFRESLSEPVELTLHLRPGSARLVLPDGAGCETCAGFRELAEALVDASEGRLRLTVLENQPGEVPVLEIAQALETSRTTFQGLPAGYEFATLLDAIERASNTASDLSEETMQALAGLESDVDLMVFVTPSCPYCPGAASLANRLALASPRVRAVTVEANEFPALAQRFAVQGVPQTVVNQSGMFVGALPEAAFVAKVLELAGEAA